MASSPELARDNHDENVARHASCTAALDRFEALAPGPALVYLAEDSLPRARERVAHLCRHRGLDLSALDLHVVTAESLRLDHDRDQHALDDTLGALRPALLRLDPLVRLLRLDGNSAADIAALLGFLPSSTAAIR